MQQPTPLDSCKHGLLESHLILISFLYLFITLVTAFTFLLVECALYGNPVSDLVLMNNNKYMCVLQ